MPSVDDYAAELTTDSDGLWRAAVNRAADAMRSHWNAMWGELPEQECALLTVTFVAYAAAVGGSSPHQMTDGELVAWIDRHGGPAAASGVQAAITEALSGAGHRLDDDRDPVSGQWRRMIQDRPLPENLAAESDFHPGPHLPVGLQKARRCLLNDP